MTQLGMTSDEYALLTIFYYVSQRRVEAYQTEAHSHYVDTIHRRRSTIQPILEEVHSLALAVQNISYVGYRTSMPCRMQEQRRHMGC